MSNKGTYFVESFRHVLVFPDDLIGANKSQFMFLEFSGCHNVGKVELACGKLSACG